MARSITAELPSRYERDMDECRTPCGGDVCRKDYYCDTKIRRQGECVYCYDGPCHPTNPYYKTACPRYCPCLEPGSNRDLNESGNTFPHNVIAVLVGCGLLALVIIGITFGLFYWKRRCLQTRTGILEDDAREKLPVPDSAIVESSGQGTISRESTPCTIRIPMSPAPESADLARLLPSGGDQSFALPRAAMSSSQVSVISQDSVPYGVMENGAAAPSAPLYS